MKSIHDEHGYRDVRRRLSRHYDVSAQDPDLQIIDADLSGSRRLLLTHSRAQRHSARQDEVRAHAAAIWRSCGATACKLVEVDTDSGATLKEHEALPMP